MIRSRFQHASTLKLLTFLFVISCTESFHNDIIITDLLVERHRREIFLRSTWSLNRYGSFNHLFVFMWLGRAIDSKLVRINLRQSNFFKSWGIQRLSLINFSHTQFPFLESGYSWAFTSDCWGVYWCAEFRKFDISELWLNWNILVFLLYKFEWRICSVFFYPLSLCFLQSTHFVGLKKSSNWIRPRIIIFSISLDFWVNLAWHAELSVMQGHLTNVANCFLDLKLWLGQIVFWWAWLVVEWLWFESGIKTFWLPIDNHWRWSNSFQRGHTHLFCFEIGVTLAQF